MNKVVIVGHAPGFYAVGKEPWIHTPSGERIASMLRCHVQDLLDLVDGDNILERPGTLRGHGDEEDAGAARVLASHPVDQPIVAAGRSVVRLLGCSHLELFEWHPCQLRDGSARMIATMPHPSGSSTWWNDRHRSQAAADWLYASVRKHEIFTQARS